MNRAEPREAARPAVTLLFWALTAASALTTVAAAAQGRPLLTAVGVVGTWSWLLALDERRRHRLAAREDARAAAEREDPPPTCRR